MQTRGKFIVLEGIDGVGTTSMTKEITAHFSKQGMLVKASQEPYSDELGPVLRKFIQGDFKDPGWMPMALVFSADRLIHCQDIYELLSDGMSVVCDRYLGSTAAYQSAMAPLDEFEKALSFITGPLSDGVLIPDLTIYLKADVEVCVQRRAANRDTVDYYERLDLQHRVSHAYDSWVQFEAEREDRKLLVVIDANRPYEKVKRDCLASVDLVFRTSFDTKFL